MTKPKGLQCVHVILEHQTRLLTLFICLQPGHQGEPGIGVVSQPRQGKSLHTNNAILFFFLISPESIYIFQAVEEATPVCTSPVMRFPRSQEAITASSEWKHYNVPVHVSLSILFSTKLLPYYSQEKKVSLT